jgi:hypothetical protein
MDWYLCSFYVGYCTVYVSLLSRCLIAICFMSFALCYVLINCFIFSIINFMFVFLLCVFCFLFCTSMFCVFVLFCVLFLPMYIVVYFLFVCNFTDHCHRVKTQLQLINIVSYHILLHVLQFHTIGLSHITSNCPTFAMFVTRRKKKFLAEFRGMYIVIRHLPSPFWSQWCFSCHHTVNGSFVFRSLSSSCSEFCEGVGITNFVRVSNNTGSQNPAVGVTTTFKVSRCRHVGIIGIKTERRNQVVIREAPGWNFDWELDYYSSVVFLIPCGQMPGLFLNLYPTNVENWASC